jgi:DNA-directed RNA polymerase specialized sigma subunit
MNNLYYPDDPEYQCWICSTFLRFSSKLGTVVDQSTGSEHICHPNITKRKKMENNEIGLSSMKTERLSQEEYYGGFHSSSQLSPNTAQTPKSIRERQRQPRTDSHSKNISAALIERYHDRLETRHNSIIRLLQSGITNKSEIAERLNISYFVAVQDILQLKAKGII